MKLEVPPHDPELYDCYFDNDGKARLEPVPGFRDVLLRRVDAYIEQTHHLEAMPVWKAMEYMATIYEAEECVRWCELEKRIPGPGEFHLLDALVGNFTYSDPAFPDKELMVESPLEAAQALLRRFRQYRFGQAGVKRERHEIKALIRRAASDEEALQIFEERCPARG